MNNARNSSRCSADSARSPTITGAMSYSRPIHNHWQSLSGDPAETDLSKRISKDLLKRGFRVHRLNDLLRHDAGHRG
ncbi:DNA-3-methyladenine glycosylase I [Candidatus Flexifilum breve]|uniref:DNA-3-methyladenine glycosylase I n=1 Tax=Candidatus Flexifilum breve TaxID=3140694 RepID=UPI0033130688